MNKKLCLVFVIGAFFSGVTQANDQSTVLSSIQSQWAEANYLIDNEKQKEAAFENLLRHADEALASFPKSAEILIWHGIVNSSYAGVKGGLGALSLVKASRVDLEKALELNPLALDGSAYTSLGTLYFKVPGWPISFGDDDMAEELLKTALTINPEGIDPNFFYAQYLLEQGDEEEAKNHLLTASKAKPRLGRELADQGRQSEIAKMLEALRSEHVN